MDPGETGRPLPGSGALALPGPGGAAAFGAAERFFEILGRDGARGLGHLLRGALGDDPSAAVAPFGAEIDHVVGALDHVEVVLDDDDRVPLGHELLEGPQEDGDVVGMKADRRLVEEIEDLPALFVDEVVGELDALELAAGERGGRLAELEVAEADLDQGIELLRDLGPAGEKEAGFGDA